MLIHNIWVNKFRGLENQYFSFTGKFDIEVSKDKIITIEKREKTFPDNFFGDTISNISAIIGKNGSGKSSALDLISYILHTYKSLTTDFFLIFEVDDLNGNSGIYFFPDDISPYKITNKGNIRLINESEFRKLSFKEIYFSNVVETTRKDLPKDIIDVSVTSYSYTVAKHKKDFFLSEIEFITQNRFAELKDELPREIEIRLSNYNTDFFRRNRNEEISTILIELRYKILKSRSYETLSYWITFFILIELSGSFVNENTLIEEVNQSSKEFNRIVRELAKYNDLREMQSVLINRLDSFHFGNESIKNDFNIILSIISNKNYLGQVRNSKEGKRSTREDIFIIPYDINTDKLIKSLVRFFNKLRPFNFQWNGLSSGHRAFINLYSRILSASKHTTSRNILLMIDEGDLYFHPQWQKEYIGKLIEFVNIVFQNKKIQIILTSHSPFIVSDLPKEQVNFLGMPNESENIKIQETFGANIIDLYNKAFFLQNGTKGLWASKKLELIITETLRKIKNGQNINEELRQIGDPLILKQIEYFKKENDAKTSD